VSADDRWVIGGSEEGACVLWDLAGEAAPQRVLAHQGRVYCAAFDAHGRRAITGAADGRAVLWDVPAMTAAVVLPGLPPHAARLKGVFGACFDPSGRFIALATSDHLVRILDARTGVERERFTVTSPMFLATDDAGRRLLIGHRWGSGLWCVDPNVASEPPIMKAHTSSITSVAASADGRFGLSTSLDRSACLWSLESEELLVAYTGHGSAVLCGAISPDARWAATGDGSGSIRLWPIDLASAASSALEAAMQASDR
jgi:WD40 repeat protein